MTTPSAPGASRRLAVVAPGEVTVGVSGNVVVTEGVQAVPSSLQDTLRGDGVQRLDEDGSVVVEGALPAAVVRNTPAWKTADLPATSVHVSSKSSPGYTGAALAGIIVGSVAAAAGVAALGVFGYWRLRRDAQRQQQEP